MRSRDDPAAAIAVTQAIDSLNRDISQYYFLNVSGVDQLLAQCQSSGISDIAFKICIVVNVNASLVMGTPCTQHQRGISVRACDGRHAS